MNFEILPIRMGIDLAIPYRLMINERVTNAHQYAFGDHKKGRVSVFKPESNPFFFSPKVLSVHFLQDI